MMFFGIFDSVEKRHMMVLMDLLKKLVLKCPKELISNTFVWTQLNGMKRLTGAAPIRENTCRNLTAVEADVFKNKQHLGAIVELHSCILRKNGLQQ